MADQCVICGKTTASFFSKWCADGVLCRDCSAALPKSIPNRRLSVSDAKELIAYEKNLKTDNSFSATASLGKLQLDEMHGMFALTAKTDADGHPVGTYEVYCLSDISELGLYPANPRSEGNRIVCDAEFQFTLKLPAVTGKLIVKQNLRCTYKRVSQEQVEWQEPGELSLLRNMLSQCAKTAAMRQIKNKIPVLTPEAVDLFQAQSAFFLQEGYTKEEIDDHRNKLLGAFCISDDIEENHMYRAWIEECYERLIADLKTKENNA